MKMYERRAAGAAEYFKLATFDARLMAWRDGKTQYDSEPAAVAAARKPGRYRVSAVTPSGRRDLEPFQVGR